MIVIRFLFTLLVGFLLGAGTMLYLVQSGTGDFLVRRTEVVQDLERRLREMEQQRDALGRKLEDVIARSERMDASFGDLERRFRELLTTRERVERDTGRVEAPSEPPPPAQ